MLSSHFRSTDCASAFVADVPFNHIHAPNSCAAGFCGKSARGPVGDAVEEMDWAVGEIMAALKANGVDENTLTFFTSGAHCLTPLASRCNILAAAAAAAATVAAALLFAGFLSNSLWSTAGQTMARRWARPTVPGRATSLGIYRCAGARRRSAAAPSLRPCMHACMG